MPSVQYQHLQISRYCPLQHYKSRDRHFASVCSIRHVQPHRDPVLVRNPCAVIPHRSSPLAVLLSPCTVKVPHARRGQMRCVQAYMRSRLFCQAWSDSTRQRSLRTGRHGYGSRWNVLAYSCGSAFATPDALDEGTLSTGCSTGCRCWCHARFSPKDLHVLSFEKTA